MSKRRAAAAVDPPPPTKGFANSVHGRQRRLIIDSDAGSDDAAAILLALRGGPFTTVEALTAVHGNVDMAQATVNLQIMSQLFTGGRVPVFAGAAHPLLGQFVPCAWPGLSLLALFVCYYSRPFVVLVLVLVD